MQLLIDIPDNEYEYYKTYGLDGGTINKVIDNAILNGIVLPKGHENLVDADKVILGLVYGLIGEYLENAKCGEIAKIFDNAVVIPADKGMCYNCQYKTDSCQEGLHCIRDSEG